MVVKARRLCVRCPYPSRAATWTVRLITGTRRVKVERTYLCDACLAAARLTEALEASKIGGGMMSTDRTEPLPVRTFRPWHPAPFVLTRAYAGTQKSVDADQKVIDADRDPVVSCLQAFNNAPVATPAPTQENTHMMLTLKGLSKNGKRAIYGGAAQSFHVPVGAFVNRTPPHAFQVEDGVFAAKVERAAKPKLSAEERKALRAAKPKPTLAERIAAREARLERDKAKLAAQPSL